jgi:hypothetical protein
MNIMFLYIIHRPIFILKHNVSESGFCLRLEAKSVQLGPSDNYIRYLRTPVPTQHKPPASAKTKQ